MQLQELWLVLAGFVLGFAISTLWEWLYYRRYRWRLYSPSVPPARQSRELEVSAFEAETLAAPAPDQRFNPEYRSPGVFLESEQESQSYPREAPRATATESA